MTLFQSVVRICSAAGGVLALAASRRSISTLISGSGGGHFAGHGIDLPGSPTRNAHKLSNVLRRWRPLPGFRQAYPLKARSLITSKALATLTSEVRE